MHNQDAAQVTQDYEPFLHIVDLCQLSDDGAEELANARLIAQAPDLFALVERFVEWHAPRPGTVPQELLDAAIMVMVKVRGQS